MLGREHVHRPALALADPGLPPGQLGHDDVGIDPVSEHVPVIAVTRDHAILVVVEGALQPDRDRFLADVEVAEPADEPEAIELPGPLLEPADEQHLLVELQKLFVARLVTR
jgi:hypothetical protein